MPRPALIPPLVCLIGAWAFAGANPEVPPVPPVVQATDQEVKTISADLDKASAEKNDEALAAGLEKLESLRSDAFVKYVRDGLKSSSPAVLAASIRAAATQEMKDVEKDVRKLLRLKPTKKEPTGLAGEVGSAGIDYLVRLELAGEEATVLDDYLHPLLVPLPENEARVEASWATDLVRASVHYLGKFKYKRAVPELVSMVGEPKSITEAPSSRKATGAGNSNPPEGYWKARSILWNKSESWVRWALKEITGQSYESQREWEAWLKMNKKDYK